MFVQVKVILDDMQSANFFFFYLLEVPQIWNNSTRLQDVPQSFSPSLLMLYLPKVLEKFSTQLCITLTPCKRETTTHKLVRKCDTVKSAKINPPFFFKRPQKGP